MAGSRVGVSGARWEMVLRYFSPLGESFEGPLHEHLFFAASEHQQRTHTVFPVCPDPVEIDDTNSLLSSYVSL